MHKKNFIKNILWTSGWDSTFRLLQLVQMDVVIQPVYIIDIERGSLKTEIKRMGLIKEMIFDRFLTSKGNILPTKFIAISDIKNNIESTKAYNALLNKTFFGGQAEWISWLSKEYPELEHCVHLNDKVEKIIKKYVSLYNDDVSGKYWKIDPNKADKDILELFGKLRYPILQYTKLDMKKEAEKNGTIDIMNKSWFCFSPIKDEPCGLCNPCGYAIEEGMGFRFSNKGLKRYKNKRIYNLIRRVRNILAE